MLKLFPLLKCNVPNNPNTPEWAGGSLPALNLTATKDEVDEADETDEIGEVNDEDDLLLFRRLTQ